MRKELIILIGIAVILIIYAAINPTGFVARGSEGNVFVVYPNYDGDKGESPINITCSRCQPSDTVDVYISYSNTEYPLALNQEFTNSGFLMEWNTITLPDGNNYKIHAYLRRAGEIIDNDYSDEYFIIDNNRESDACREADNGLTFTRESPCTDMIACDDCRDLCLSETTVLEYYCDIGSVCKSEHILCPPGEECLNGACQ